MLLLKVFSLFTPALCATLLRRADVEHHEKRGVLGWFNRVLARSGTDRYDSAVARVIGKPKRYMVTYLLIAGVVALLFMRSSAVVRICLTRTREPSYVDLRTGRHAAPRRRSRSVKKVEAYYIAVSPKSISSSR